MNKDGKSEGYQRAFCLRFLQRGRIDFLCEKMTAIQMASSASISYFAIFMMLRLFLQGKTLDWQSALLGAVIFWVIIFLINKSPNRVK